MQIRCLLEGESVDKILNEWHKLLPAYMDKWDLDRSQVKNVISSSMLAAGMSDIGILWAGEGWPNTFAKMPTVY